MKTLGERLRLLRAEKKLTQQQVADKIGVSKSSVLYWERDENTPKHDSLMALVRSLNTSVDYLLYGAEEIETWDDTTPLDGDEVEIPFFKDIESSSFDIKKESLREKRRLRMSKVTLDRLDIKRKNVFSTTVPDDSMTPIIKAGDTIHVDTGRKNIKNGKIFAISHGGIFTIKRLYSLPLGGVRIVSDNSTEYPEDKLSAENILDQDFKIIGWVWSWQALETW